MQPSNLVRLALRVRTQAYTSRFLYNKAINTNTSAVARSAAFSSWADKNADGAYRWRSGTSAIWLMCGTHYPWTILLKSGLSCLTILYLRLFISLIFISQHTSNVQHAMAVLDTTISSYIDHVFSWCYHLHWHGFLVSSRKLAVFGRQGRKGEGRSLWRHWFGRRRRRNGTGGNVCRGLRVAVLRPRASGMGWAPQGRKAAGTDSIWRLGTQGQMFRLLSGNHLHSNRNFCRLIYRSNGPCLLCNNTPSTQQARP